MLPPDGDVGIGTTTLAAQLDVNGTARATTVEITGGLALGYPLPGWGSNTYGESSDVPTGTFIAFAAGSNNSLAIRSNGTLVGWGIDNYGRTNVPAGTFTAVAAGGGFQRFGQVPGNHRPTPCKLNSQSSIYMTSMGLSTLAVDLLSHEV